ncbi:MAG: type III polyketide synthase [Candidatus Caenarcaniphilales bacterium]|nr:type III polyketide synthase [Candidatus Caenarcaniphilales bacterium]
MNRDGSVPQIDSIRCEAGLNKYEQAHLIRFLESNMAFEGNRKMQLLLSRIRRRLDIVTRNSCLPAEYFAENSELGAMSTGARQILYESYSRLLLDRLLDGFKPKHPIQNLITVSCTGYQTPGLDFQIIERLGLKNPFRYNVGAMGCYAGITGLRLANELSGNTLLVCLELCSLHFQADCDFSSVASNALFADGTVMVEVGLPSTRGKDQSSSLFEIKSFASYQIPHTLDKMSWLLRDHGFIMFLDPEVPELIAGCIEGQIVDWLAGQGLSTSDIRGWVIHPGSTSIVHTVQKCLKLDPSVTEHSLNVLRKHGNMSSGTVFFILEDLMQQKDLKPGDKVVMVAFGPGLMAEMCLVEKT